jgi:hypothetical protein
MGATRLQRSIPGKEKTVQNLDVWRLTMDNYAPFGLIPIGHISGGAIPEPHEYVLVTGATAYKGDPMILTNAGTVTVSAAGQTTTHMGVAAEYVSDSGSAAGKKIKVYDDPGIIYKMFVGTGVTASSQTYVFNTADHITYAAPTGAQLAAKISCMALDTLGTTTTLPFIVLGLYESPDNAWDDTYVVVKVKYNRHAFFGGAGL